MHSTTLRLEITYVRTASLKPNPRNPRVHTDKQVRQIAKSIESFGMGVQHSKWSVPMMGMR